MKKENLGCKMPRWIWGIPPRELPYSVKHFYAYLCVFGPDTNWQWNCRLAKKFRVTPRTIRRWLALLKKYRFIWIESGDGRNRKIHPRYYKDLSTWIRDVSIPKATRQYKKRFFKRGH